MTPNYLKKSVDVAIVGAGPVGLTASLLLSRIRVHHLVIEKQLEPTEHPFLVCGIARQKMIDLANQLQNEFFPLKKIYISDNDPLPDETGFAFAGDRPSFLPPRFAALVRPDAVVAWLETR